MKLNLIYTCCPLCHEESSVAVDEKGYGEFLAGKPIGEAMPYLTEPQKEKLNSGLCHNCWMNFFPEE
ncbi:hypothetical protein SAMN05720470_10830 [Fibrobacter sp. UWOV1]|uniref:hypothetical protein n=1 Tax=Fibrobacter sp. UWOV1 TaxID=1896215 RepID=UPI0009190138|nr:hypothetical protein [Fibrobacter sp. UWOV1]SHL41832.1 hypothetical protein SAMN05720470_10830 [Fibrobacter sp. UWOV1]